MDDRVPAAGTARAPGLDPALEKLRHLLSYVEQVVRLDEQPVFRLSEHRLATGQRLVLHQHEMDGLPGLRLGIEDAEGPIWLALERLKRSDPPPPPAALAEWIEVSADPERAPTARDFVLRTLERRQRDCLVSSGQAREEDCAEAPAQEGRPKELFDVRLRLEDRPQVRAEIDAFVADIWRPWAEGERPRWRSIALYQGLFEMAQLAALGPGDRAFELVWGMGLARWRRDGREIDLPLIERLVEIELDEAEGAEIRVRPRETAAAAVNLRAFEELKVDGAPLALDAARRLLARAEADGAPDVTPFDCQTFEPILRACQARLDGQGRYVADPADASAPREPPAPAGEHLAVHGRWVIFARRRSDNFVLADLEAMREALDGAESAAEALPGPARTLVLGPGEASADASWTPLANTIGETTYSESAASAQSEGLDLFFPKPFNDDQVEIVRRLEQADGIVVQGPPGTGKTHTIANIICHAMATGRRVLVVSHAEPALAVLRDQLPEGVRDLAISITATEREGLRQLESAIRMLQSIVEGMKPGEQLRHIRELEASVVRHRARLDQIDAELAEIARRQHEPHGPRGEAAADLAARVAGARDRFGWFVDRPEKPAGESGIGDAAIAALRSARATLGPRLKEINARLPRTADLPEASAVGRWHDDLVQAQELAAAAARDAASAMRLPDEAGLAGAERALEGLALLREADERAAEEPWLAEIEAGGGPLAPVLKPFVSDAAALVAERGRFLARPVEAPEELEDSAEALGLVAGLAAGESVFGWFNFRARALRDLIDKVEVEGRAPSGPTDWAHARDYLSWRGRYGAVAARWTALAEEFGAPAAVAATPRALERLVQDLRRALDGVPAARRDLAKALSHLALSPAEAACLAEEPQGRARLEAVLRTVLAAARLGRARGEVRRLEAFFPEGSGTLGALARDLLRTGVGRTDLAGAAVAHLWDGIRTRIADLEGHSADFETVRAVAQRLAQEGAPRWAERLLTEPASGSTDSTLPSDWREAWDWAAQAAHLAAIDPRSRSAALSAERTKLDADLRKTFERLVRERTFYALAGAMTPGVRSALMMFATALRRTGKGTGQGAGRHRRAARAAMASCYGAIPCWIMPSWRVAEQLPARLGSFDLVIMDEASQSDVRELPALLRGKKILVVGDDRQVSPTAAFIPNAALDRLEHGFLKGQPFRTLLLPGSSLYDLAKVMFPDRLVMLREHFRCVEPIIRFSMQFYPEPLVPLRVPTAGERLDPPLIDIYVPDGRRTGDKINAREAEVVVEEIRRFVDDPVLAVNGHGRPRSIGVISLIGPKQAALINYSIVNELGEEVVLRHRIACGDSATFQGNERDVIFLSMVADPRTKQAQTATHFEQRFNVALSRARDRLVLVRSVEEDELNPADLKARVIRHFRAPMPDIGGAPGDLEALCESDFERAVLRRLVALGYRVRPQVGALGFRIDLVAEGTGDRRLAIECDGDRHHGPERWADDMRRQRILERVGWRFWRCWASSFALDPEGSIADLVATLERAGIAPAGDDASQPSPYILHRTADPSSPAAEEAAGGEERRTPRAGTSRGLGVGDRVVVRRVEDGTSATYTLSADRDDPVNGWLGMETPLGAALLGRSEEDEVEVDTPTGRERMLVLRTERAGQAPSGM